LKTRGAKCLLKSRKAARRAFHFIRPQASLGGIQECMNRYVDFSNGFFVEAGANDGVSQSNTYYLARRQGWTGILIEPIPHLASIARRWRRDASVEEVCLVAPNRSGQPMEMLDLDLQSVPLGDVRAGNQVSEISLPNDVKRASRIVRVQTETLSGVLARYGNPQIDFLSLDVEGYELEVLRGLNLDKDSPSLILVETEVPNSIANLLGDLYVLREQCSYHDYLFERKY